MKVFYSLLVVLLFVVSVRAQDCDSIVVDQVGAFKLGELESVATNAKKLVDQGVDVRVRTVGQTSNLDMDEKNLERACRSWQSPNGGRKSTLIVLMVSPASRKMGIYYGNAFEHALVDHWNRIKTDYMGPHFKSGDWAGGFIATEQQLAARIAASKDEVVHPAMNTTVNQAADFSGLWAFMKWGLFFVVLIAGTYFLFFWRSKKRKELQELREARVKAINAKAQASNALGVFKNSPRIDEALKEFTRLDSLMRSDPYAEDLEIGEYNAIAEQYLRVSSMLGTGTFDPQFEKKVAKKSKSAAAAAAPAPAAPSTTVIYGPSEIPVPIIISEPEPERHRASPSRSTDSDSGGSSSWSDTSSSDGGGSSDFGGGDSGSSGDSGGGSSDF